VAVNILEKIAQQRKLLKAMAKELEKVPQAWRGQTWAGFQKTYVEEQAKLKSMLAKSKGKAVVGGALGAATAGALSEDDAEAAPINFGGKAFREMFGKMVRELDDEKLVELFKRHDKLGDDTLREIYPATKLPKETRAWDDAPQELRDRYKEHLTKGGIVSTEMSRRGIQRPRLFVQGEVKFPENEEAIKNFGMTNQKPAVDEMLAGVSERMRLAEESYLNSLRNKEDSHVGIPPGVDFNVIEGGGETTPRGPVGPKKLGIAGAAVGGGIGAGLAATPAEAQEEGMPQGGSLRSRMLGRPFQSRYQEEAAVPTADASHLPSMEGGEVNPTSGRLRDQMVGRPFISRYDQGQTQDMYDAFQGQGGGNFSPEVEEGMNRVRQGAINKALGEFGGDPIVQQRMQELTTGGSQADFSDVEGGQSSTAPDQIYPTALPQSFEEMRDEFPPPSPGMIPQEQVEGDPDADKPWLGPGTGGIGEFGKRLAAYGKAAYNEPVSAGGAMAADFGGDILDLLTQMETMGMGGEAPPNFLRGPQELLTQNVVDVDPNNEDLVRRMVEAESSAVDPTWLGKGLEAAKLLGTGAAIGGGAAMLRGGRAAGVAERGFGKMAMGRPPSFKQAPRFNVNPPAATATRLPSVTGHLRKVSDSTGKALAGIRNFFAPLGARHDVARLYREKAARKALTKGLAGAQESYDNLANSIQVGFAQRGRDLVEAMMRTTGGDPTQLKALGRQLWTGSKHTNLGLKNATLRGVDPAVRQAFDEAVTFTHSQIDNLERSGAISAAEATEYRKLFGGSKLQFFDALRDPDHLNKMRNSNPWNQLYGLIQRTNPNMPANEIVGEMEGLLADTVVENFEKTGKVSQAYLRSAPGIQSIVGYKATDPLLRKLLGEVDDFPSALQLGGEVISKKLAHQHVGSRLIQDLYDVGIAGSTRAFGEAVPSHLVPKGQPKTFMPKEIIDALKFGTQGAEAISNLNRAAAAWRIGKTVGSPTSAGVLNYVSGITDSIFSGHALDPKFWTVDLPDAYRAGMEVTRRGVARGAQGFERGLVREGLGPGSIAGELGQYMRRAGMLPGYTGTSRLYEKVPRRLQGFTRGMARFFEQGDVIYKRAIAPRMVAENTVAMKNLHPDDAQLLEATFGSSNPVQIASGQIKNEFQSYQMTGHGLKEFSKRHPVFGPFVSFTVEQARNAGQHVSYLGKELKVAKYAKTPELRNLMLKRAMKHATGIIVGASLPSLAREAWETANGKQFTDKQREILEKRAVPDYEQGNVAMLDRKGDGRRILRSAAWCTSTTCSSSASTGCRQWHSACVASGTRWTTACSTCWSMPPLRCCRTRSRLAPCTS
jgi:hypothetical protein